MLLFRTVITRRSKILCRLAALILAAALIAMWVPQITDGPIISDAEQSLRMAVNLEKHGVLALETAAPYTPTNFREPLFPLATALMIRVIETFKGEADAETYFAGDRLRWLKYQNIFWLGLLTVASFWAASAFTGSRLAGFAAALLINVPFRPKFPSELINDLMTEIPATALLVAASCALALGFTRRSSRLYLAAGVLFGALTLTKAVALYVFICLLPLLVLLYLWDRPRTSSVLQPARHLALLVAGFAAVLAPWLIRNQIQLGTHEVTQRAGYALIERSLLDAMTDNEFKGAIYLWAPDRIKGRLGESLGYSAADLAIGGRLQRLNDDPDSPVSQADLPLEMAGQPEGTVTFFRRARAEMMRIVAERTHAGSAQPGVEAEAIGKQLGMSGIAANPMRHLLVTVLCLWRASLLTTGILTATLLLGLWQRRFALVLFVVPSLGIIAAYAMTSPFFPRYDIPMHLLTIMLLPIVAWAGWQAVRGRLRTRAAALQP